MRTLEEIKMRADIEVDRYINAPSDYKRCVLPDAIRSLICYKKAMRGAL